MAMPDRGSRARPVSHPRARLAVLAAGLTLFAHFVEMARAEPASTPVIGNALNVGLAAGRPAKQSQPGLERSPMGILYDYPDRLPENRESSRDGWQFRNEIEFGGLAGRGERDNPLFGRYRDVDPGFLLHHLAIVADRPDDASFVEVLAGSVAREDSFLSLLFGRRNAWSVRAFLGETPSVSTDGFHSLWDGVGTDRLRLATLAPGGQGSFDATQAALRDALAAAPATRLAITRQKGGVRVDARLTQDWRLFAAVATEKKRGASPFGMTFGGGDGGGSIETAESVDSATHDFQAGASYFDQVNSFNVSLQGSFFRNALDTLTIDNPLTIAVNTVSGVPPSAFTTARFDQPPDNDFLKAKVEYARRLPAFFDARFSAVVAATRSRQDDALIAPTTLSLSGGTIDGVPAVDAWNTTDALSRKRAGTRVDSALVNLDLLLNPAPGATLRANLRRNDFDSAVDYAACNPLTGQWGRLLNDGSGGAFVATPAYLAAGCDIDAVRAIGIAPSAGNVHLGAVAYGHAQTNASLAAGWRPGATSNLTLLVEREQFEREHRERDRTWEDKARMTFAHRGSGAVTGNLFVEHARRRGSGYATHPNEEFLSASMGPLPTATNQNFSSWIRVMDGMRRFDLSDRDRDTLNARLNWAATPDVDVGLSTQLRNARYPGADYGRTGTQRQASVGLEANWQASAEFALFGHVAWQASRTLQGGVQANSCVAGITYHFFSNGAVNTSGVAPAGASLVGTTQVTPADALAVCGAAGPLSPLYPLSRAWEQDQRDDNRTMGLGVRRDFGAARLDASYTYANARTTSAYSFNASALGLTPAQVALIGTGFPEARVIRNTLEANLTCPIGKAMSARLYVRYERGRIRDWHYDGVADNPVPDVEAAYLDTGPRPYSASTVGFFVRLEF